jgi:hypothetical protein
LLAEEEKEMTSKVFRVIVCLAGFLTGWLLGKALFAADCIYDGDPYFAVPGQSWCDIGAFDRVHMEMDEEKGTSFAYFVLNDDGIAHFNADTQNAIPNTFLEMVTKGLHGGVESTYELRHNGDILLRCWAKPKGEGLFQPTCEWPTK